MSELDFYASGNYDKVAISAQGGIVAKIFHSRAEAGIKAESLYNKVLEVGALSGQHLPFVKHNFKEWHLLDIVPNSSSFEDDRVSFTQGNVEDLPFEDDSFDRVLTTCVLHHLDNPIRALSEMRRVTKPGGNVTIFLPIHPGVLYDSAWKITTLRRAKKLGLEEDATMAMALGHKNHYQSLYWQVKKVFQNDNAKHYYWPSMIHSQHLNMFHTIQYVVSEKNAD